MTRLLTHKFSCKSKTFKKFYGRHTDLAELYKKSADDSIN